MTREEFINSRYGEIAKRVYPQIAERQWEGIAIQESKYLDFYVHSQDGYSNYQPGPYKRLLLNEYYDTYLWKAFWMVYDNDLKMFVYHLQD